MATIERDGYHYPPDLLELTVKAISVLLRGKQGVIDFFRGCAVPAAYLRPHQEALLIDKDSVKKAAIARDVLTALNAKNDDIHLRARREFSSDRRYRQRPVGGAVPNPKRAP